MNEQAKLIADIKVLASELAIAYGSLRGAVCAMQVAEAKTTEARAALATARAGVLINHSDDIKALGTNEAVREANISKLIEAEKAAMADAEFAYTSCRNTHQLATIDVEALRAQLRCLEATALVVGGKDGR